MTAGTYAKLARSKISEIIDHGKQVVLVGGSGLYYRALFEGLFQGPPIDIGYREVLRARAKQFGVPALHNELMLLDPTLAVKIQPNDYPRIERGLEVFYASGTPMSQWWEHGTDRFGYTPHYFGIQRARANIVERIALRTKEMLAGGWIEEVKALLIEGYGDAIEREKFHGYRELAAYLKTEISLAEAEEKINIVTRQYAKRQMTWFRHTANVTWMETPDHENAGITADRIMNIVIHYQEDVE
jgi:tRNA dimethylallyltransferase